METKLRSARALLEEIQQRQATVDELTVRYRELADKHVADKKVASSLERAKAALDEARSLNNGVKSQFDDMGRRVEAERNDPKFQEEGTNLRIETQGNTLPSIDSKLQSVQQNLYNAEQRLSDATTSAPTPATEAQATVVTPEPAHTEPELAEEDVADPDVDVDALPDEPVEADEQPLPGVARQLAAFAGVDTESLSDEEIGTLTLADCDAAFHELSEKDQRNRTAALSANGRFIKNRPAAAAQQSKPVAASSSDTEPGEWKQKASAFVSKLKGHKKKHHNNRGTAL